VIGHPWSRATLPGAKVAAGYLTVKNTGDTPDRLIAVSSDIAAKGEMHQMSVDAKTGVMTMRPANGIDIAPGETVKLEPGGYHLMFVDLKQPVEQGARFKGTLTFEKAGSVDVDYAAESAGGKPGKPAAEAGASTDGAAHGQGHHAH